MSIQEDLKSAILATLPDVSCVIGWGPGPDALHGASLFMREAGDVADFTSGFFAVNNPALFLPEYKGSKVAVVVKGCDSRSVGQLLAEGLIKREEVHVIGFPCTGVIDHDKVNSALAGRIEPGEVRAVREEGAELVLTFPAVDGPADGPGREIRLNKKEVTADKCGRCMYPSAFRPRPC